MVVGFGGGSAIDAAKAAAVGIPLNADLGMMERYLLHGDQPGTETLPIIAIPTTAGTGSELSKGAILSSERHNIKSGIRGDNIVPTVAMVDAKFTWTVPLRITMETGFDALSHAIESYVSVKANVFSEVLSEKAIQSIGVHLRALREDLNNHAAREQMSFASMIMGMNLANVGTCLPHRIQYPVGISTGTSHAAGLAAVYPAWIGHEYKVNKVKISTVYKLLKLDMADRENLGLTFKRFLEELGIGYSLSELGVKREDVTSLAERVTGNIKNDILANEENVITTLIEESL